MAPDTEPVLTDAGGAFVLVEDVYSEFLRLLPMQPQEAARFSAQSSFCSTRQSTMRLSGATSRSTKTSAIVSTMLIQ